MAISFQSQDCEYLPKSRAKISAWIRQTVKDEGYNPGDVAFVFCSPEYHIGINRQYLGHDYHTDVITFDYSELEDGGIVSGDILIDPRRVKEQAQEWGSSDREEELRVMVHGVLHLCGYKDKEAQDQVLMRSKEDHYLSQYLIRFGSYD